MKQVLQASMRTRAQARETLIPILAEHLLRTGLSQSSLRQLAQAAGASDRMLMYYFTDKTELLRDVLFHLATGFALKLDQAVPNDIPLSFPALLNRAVRATLEETLQPYLRLWIEVLASAAREEVPFTQMSADIFEGFRRWAETRLDEPDAEKRRVQAALVVSMVDGFGVLALCVDGSEVEKAINALAERLEVP
jgi:AcrR family transcriptional regulator